VDELGPLEAWAADARAREAGAERSRQRWMERAAGEDATMASVLAALRDAGDEVVVGMSTGRNHRAWVRGVGRDAVALASARGREVLVASWSVVTVRPVVARARLVDGVVDDIGLATELATWSPGCRVEAVVAGGDVVAGELGPVGVDVVTLTLAAPDRPVVYIALGSLSEVSRLESG
jgi:hypothetical protein